MIKTIVIFKDTANPNARGRLEIGAADDLAVEVLRRFDSGGGIDEDETVPEAPMQKSRNSGQRLALVADYEIGADILLADVEFVLAAHAPVPLARPHFGKENEIEAIGFHQPLFERTHDVIVAAGHRQFKFAHCALLLSSFYARQRP